MFGLVPGNQPGSHMPLSESGDQALFPASLSASCAITAQAWGLATVSNLLLTLDPAAWSNRRHPTPVSGIEVNPRGCLTSPSPHNLRLFPLLFGPPASYVAPVVPTPFLVHLRLEKGSSYASCNDPDP